MQRVTQKSTKITAIASDVSKSITDLPNKPDQRALARWAADCAEHVLPYFEEKYPKDERPRKAIEAVRAWVRGEIRVGEARTTAVAAHAAARDARGAGQDAACFAARAAGHAAGTAHVAGHAKGAAAYAIKAASAHSNDVDNSIIKERNWQLQRLHRIADV